MLPGLTVQFHSPLRIIVFKVSLCISAWKVRYQQGQLQYGEHTIQLTRKGNIFVGFKKG